MHRAIASSVTIAYGTDAGVFPHNQTIKTLRYSSRSACARSTCCAPRRRTPTRDIAVLESEPALVMLGGQNVDLSRLPAGQASS